MKSLMLFFVRLQLPALAGFSLFRRFFNAERRCGNWASGIWENWNARKYKKEKMNLKLFLWAQSFINIQ